MSKSVTLKKNEHHRIVSGHLWAFSNEIAATGGEPGPGDLVRLLSSSGQFLGIGTYNPHSLIAVRLLTRTDEEIGFQYFRKRIETALALRRKLYANSETFRLVHGESDFLPGLVIDKYNDLLTVQTFSCGMDRRLTLICDVLESVVHPRGIVERNESAARSLESLESRKGVLRGEAGPVTISEFGLKYEVDLLEGQKTGFFLDQRENRRSIRRYATGGSVLDCFCNDGGFALNAAFAGASEVLGVDISDPAIGRARRNSTLNSLQERVRFETSDGFDFLPACADRGSSFDLVILDPPSFTKSKRTVSSGVRGYRQIHLAAFRLLKPGGILATASCSHHLYDDKFLEIVADAAQKSGRRMTLLEWRGAAPDHPVLPAMPETRYLKFGIFSVE